MKALKVIATSLITVAILGVQVLAAAPSPTVTSNVKIKKATLADGTDITANLVVTPMSAMNSTPYPEVKASLQAASDEFNAASNKVANLKGTDGKPLEATLKTLSGLDDVSGLTATEIVDVSYVVNGKVTALPSECTIEFEAQGNIVLHRTANGWTAASGMTQKVSSLSPFAFLTAKGASGAGEKKADGGQTSPQTGEYVTKAVLVGAVVLAAAGIVCVVRAKKSSAN